MKSLKMMVLGLSVFFSLAGLVFASECTSLMAQIDEKLETVELSEEKQEQVEQLRAEGETAHESGDHDKAVEILNRALEIIQG